MAFTQADLQSAAAKLATLDFAAAELEAIATTIRGHGSATGDDDVAGFVFEPNDANTWAKGFIPEVAGLMKMPGKGIVHMDEGETI